jgi:protein tyrosine phosphatase (PTP) superfamily phosphohydrolase (DUF442 family)
VPKSSGGAAGKTSYLPRRGILGTRIARQRRESLPSTTIATPAPTTRSEQAASSLPPEAAEISRDQFALDHLPPLDLPGEVTRYAATPPAQPAAERAARSSNESKQARPDAEHSVRPLATEPDPNGAAGPAPEFGPSASVGPGLAHFVAVDLKLAGGSAPSSAGLKWLFEKGYRTVLDLRESSEVPSTFIAEVARYGLRYVALPIGPSTLDADHVARFQFELAAPEARPLYFFDSQGDRAGALWYIRRVLVDRVDAQIARREAKELGLKDDAYWLASDRYIASLSSPAAKRGSGPKEPEARPGVLDAPKATSAPSSSPSSDQSTPSTTSAEKHDQNQPPAPPAAPTAAQAPGISDPKVQAAPVAQPSIDEPEKLVSAIKCDPAGVPVPPPSWRPLAAMVLTALSLPLAFWGRSIVPAILATTRASLPGPRRGPRSLPGGSGA